MEQIIENRGFIISHKRSGFFESDIAILSTGDEVSAHD